MINSCPYQYLGVVTLLHDIIAIVGLIGHYPSSFWIIRKREETFRQNNQLLSWDVILPHRLPNQFLGNALSILPSTRKGYGYIRVHVRGIPGLDSCVPGGFQQGECFIFV